MGIISSKKKVKVYIWGQRGGNVGHASLQIPKGAYISYWPGDSLLSKGMKAADGLLGDMFLPKKMNNQSGERAMFSQSLDEDIVNENGFKPMVFKVPIHSRNFRSMTDSWERFKEETAYNLLANNCCDAVIAALNAGACPVMGNSVLPNNPTDLAKELRDYLIDNPWKQPS